MSVVYIIGSFQADRERQAAKAALEAAGVTCLMSEEGDPLDIRGSFKSIQGADAVYVVNPDGLVGKSACVDIGYALALRRPVFTMKPLEDPPVAALLEPPVSALDLPSQLAGKRD